ncbi:MBL fold metallo-hydrolase RNA specificity domain-containing protein [Candidatus Aalborgicola defluviihabitans]|uniref:MBL fold metallo-hydrolase RNA specificity domain-containing protein n=1 Tax=Candidatus Aalborgicola defluviihabitans TaxID=3386187 RepID=UPI001EC7E93D|nr:MBL fold metallo-hydrolase [Burkholderiales bacterium]
MSVSITFLGGADTVTGSKYLVRQGDQCLMVDCGLFQGYKQLRLRNWTPLPIAPNTVDAVVLTHAHLDHSGYLPLLVKEGFTGRVYASPGTQDLCKILLPDSGHIQEEDAAFANRHGLSKHTPALPLYSRQDALDCLPQINPDDMLMYPPDPPPVADTVLIESTYGDRQHPSEDLMAELGPALHRLAARGGVAVVPVFAVGRAQAVLHAIAQLKANGQVPHALPVFLDSPMAVHTTHLFEKHMGEHRLTAKEAHALTHSAVMINSTDESRALSARHGPMVILSASGMATGGRVLHHLEQRAGDHRNMIILTGYQAPGTRGAKLANGDKSIRIHGHDVDVKAEVVQLQSASAHADADQLLNWLRSMPGRPDQVYVVHGDQKASDTLRGRIEHELDMRAMVPEHGSTWPS